MQHTQYITAYGISSVENTTQIYHLTAFIPIHHKPNITSIGISSVASQSKRNLYRGASDGETKYEYTLLAIPPVKFGGQFFGDWIVNLWFTKEKGAENRFFYIDYCQKTPNCFILWTFCYIKINILHFLYITLHPEFWLCDTKTILITYVISQITFSTQLNYMTSSLSNSNYNQ